MRLVPRFGPWFMTYRVGPQTRGAMLSTGGTDISVSGGVFGCALVVGWRFRKELFRDRKLVLGQER